MLRHKRGMIMRKRGMALIFFLVLILLAYIFSPRGRVDVTNYTIQNSKIPQKFDGFKIVQVSDYHNEDWEDKIVNLIKKENPDIIAVTGDLIDSRKTNPDLAYEFINKIKDICPIFYVTGNHEAVINYKPIENKLKSLGLVMLDGQSKSLNKGEDKILISGIEDPKFINDYMDNISEAIIENKLNNDIIDQYVRAGVNLVLTGHAHGGQFRLPFVGGVIAPTQGLFPRYYQGQHIKNNTSMIVSRGLGDSIIPIRINNNFELVVIELKSK